MTADHDDAADAFAKTNHAKRRRQLRRAIDKLETDLLTVTQPAAVKRKSDQLDKYRAELAKLPAGDDDDQGDDDVKQSERIVRMCEATYDVFPSSEEGNGLIVAVERNGPNLAFPIKGSNGLRPRLAAAFRRANDTTPSANTMTEAMAVIEGQALDVEVREVRRRVGWHEGSIVLDLGAADGASVVVRAGDWEVVPRSPITFIRSASLTLPLPRPVRVTDWRTGLKPLRELLNIEDDDWPLVLAWLVHAWSAEQAHTILRLQGEQGSCKSTAAEMLVQCIDPSTSMLRSVPTNLHNWATTASGSWAFALDNLSWVEQWFSDALCRAVTGEAFVTRTLYSDADVSVMLVQRAMIVTTIGMTTTAGDLAERTVPVELHRPTERLTDGEVTDRFTAAWPGIVAALLELTAAVLATMPTLSHSDLPRMADYAQVLRSIDAVLTPGDEPGFTRYTELSAELMTEVAEGNPLAEALRKWIVTVPGWSWKGRATDLLTKLTDAQPWFVVPKGWPHTPHALSQHLTRLAPALRRSGLNIVKGRDEHGSRIEINFTTPASRVKESASAPSGASADPDGDDGADGDFPTRLQAEGKKNSGGCPRCPRPLTADGRCMNPECR